MVLALMTVTTSAMADVRRHAIDTVPSGFRVGFCLLTHGAHQYAAYYNAKHQMTVAKRALGSETWTREHLPSKIGWDSHNYITMAVDKDGILHLAGNMHAVPLIYFRSEKPGDIRTFKKLAMTGESEGRATYPKFLTNLDGELVFNYRNGGSGRGMRIYNIYDRKTRTWSRLLDAPLLDGQGKRNAYPLGPVRGPDGLFHMMWVWRDTPDCETNHDLSYARSRDLVHWETITGEKVQLPMTLSNKALIVDPIPSGGGIINGSAKLSFDRKNRPLINYHKNDANGHMQLYVTRYENGGWNRKQLTRWDKPVIFKGRGSMPFIGIYNSVLKELEPGILSMSYRHKDYGSGRLFVDESSLQTLDKKVQVPRLYPKELTSVGSKFKGMGVRRAVDLGSAEKSHVTYLLQWETLGSNHDRPRTGPLPEASLLELIEIRK